MVTVGGTLHFSCYIPENAMKSDLILISSRRASARLVCLGLRNPCYGMIMSLEERSSS